LRGIRGRRGGGQHRFTAASNLAAAVIVCPSHPSSPFTAAQHNRYPVVVSAPQLTFMARCGLMPQRSDPTGIGETRGREGKAQSSKRPFFKREELNFELLFCLCSCGLLGSDQSVIRHTHTHTNTHRHMRLMSHNTHTPIQSTHQRKLSIMMRLLSRPPKMMFFGLFPVHSDPFLCLMIGPLMLYLYPPIYGCLSIFCPILATRWLGPALPR
jgi:hypothetical protein